MPGWNRKGFAACALFLGLAVLNAGLLLGCHKSSKPDDFTQPPYLLDNYTFPTMLATVGQSFASVIPPVRAYYYDNGVGSTETLGFAYSVSGTLPSGLSLNSTTGVISGTPLQVSPTTEYSIHVSNVRHDGGGVLTYTVSLGVQASSPVTMTYGGQGALSTAVGIAIHLSPPTLNKIDGVQVVATGFGVSPALPAGLTLSPSTGVVSGAATGALSPTVFTVTATAAQGSADASFTLRVTATPPAAPMNLSYANNTTGNPANLVVGHDYTNSGLAPFVDGTDLVFTVIPALPAGLSLNPTSGVISGIPTAIAPLTGYAVTASNAGGSTTPAEVYLEVTDSGQG